MGKSTQSTLGGEVGAGVGTSTPKGKSSCCKEGDQRRAGVRKM